MRLIDYLMINYYLERGLISERQRRKQIIEFQCKDFDVKSIRNHEKRVEN